MKSSRVLELELIIDTDYMSYTLLLTPILQIALIVLVASLVRGVEVAHVVEVQAVIVVDLKLGTCRQTDTVDVVIVLRAAILPCSTAIWIKVVSHRTQGVERVVKLAINVWLPT